MKHQDRFLEFINRKGFRKGWSAFIVAFFLFFIVLPTVYVVTYAFTDWDAISLNVLNNPETMDGRPFSALPVEMSTAII